MERSRDWMDQAEGDLAHAKSDMERGFYDRSCFSSQQAGEKAVFQEMGSEAWGHSVVDLLKELSRRHRVLPGPDIPRRRRGGSLPMRRRSSSSVRIFYPKFDKEEIIRVLSERLKEFEEKLPLVHVVLFGSYAEGNYTVGSDVDILVVYRGERRDDTYAVVKKVLDIPRLEPHLYTEEEYERMKGTLSKMTEGGVVLLSKDEGGWEYKTGSR